MRDCIDLKQDCLKTNKHNRSPQILNSQYKAATYFFFILSIHISLHTTRSNSDQNLTWSYYYSCLQRCGTSCGGGKCCSIPIVVHLRPNKVPHMLSYSYFTFLFREKKSSSEIVPWGVPQAEDCFLSLLRPMYSALRCTVPYDILAQTDRCNQAELSGQ